MVAPSVTTFGAEKETVSKTDEDEENAEKTPLNITFNPVTTVIRIDNVETPPHPEDYEGDPDEIPCVVSSLHAFFHQIRRNRYIEKFESWLRIGYFSVCVIVAVISLAALVCSYHGCLPTDVGLGRASFCSLGGVPNPFKAERFRAKIVFVLSGFLLLYSLLAILGLKFRFFVLLFFLYTFFYLFLVNFPLYSLLFQSAHIFYNFGMQAMSKRYWNDTRVHVAIDWVQSSYNCCLFHDGHFKGYPVDTCYPSSEQDHSLYHSLLSPEKGNDPFYQVICTNKTEISKESSVSSQQVSDLGRRRNDVRNGDCGVQMATSLRYLTMTLEAIWNLPFFLVFRGCVTVIQWNAITVFVILPVILDCFGY